MQQSNIYIIGYTAALTIVCALGLALAAVLLKPRQDANIDMERKRNILSSVMKIDETVNVSELYDSRVKEFVVDFSGNIVEGKKTTDITIAAEWKKPAAERLLPVYQIMAAADPNKVEFYVFPVYGFGLWNDIWGYVSFGSDLNTIKGVKFDHKGETPGLGARISTDEIQQRFIGKSIFDQAGSLVSVEMQKGEGNDYNEALHKVDGMSGATLTAKGLNAMLKDYFQSYEKFIKSRQGSTPVVSMN